LCQEKKYIGQDFSGNGTIGQEIFFPFEVKGIETKFSYILNVNFTHLNFKNDRTFNRLAKKKGYFFKTCKEFSGVRNFPNVSGNGS